MKNQHTAKNKAEVAKQVAEHIVQKAKETLQQQDRFTIALAGGSTPKGLYHLLASEAYRDQIDWSKVYFFFGDERTVPADHDDSNYKMAYDAMLGPLDIAEDHVFRMEGERPPQEAAAQYDAAIQSFFGESGQLDYTLLGMGEDGHTASLFPHTSVLQVYDRRAAAVEVPKLNTWRISLSIPFLRKSQSIAMLIAGAGKAEMLHRVLTSPYQPNEYPIQFIFHASPQVHWFVDEAATALL